MNEILWLSLGFGCATLFCWYLYRQKTSTLRGCLNDALERCAALDGEKAQILAGHEREILRITEAWRGYSNKTIAEMAAQKDAEIAAVRREKCPFVVQLRPLVFRQSIGWLSFGRSKVKLGFEVSFTADHELIGASQIIFQRELTVKISTKEHVEELLQEALEITRAYCDQQGESIQRYIQLIPARFIE